MYNCFWLNSSHYRDFDRAFNNNILRNYDDDREYTLVSLNESIKSMNRLANDKVPLNTASVNQLIIIFTVKHSLSSSRRPGDVISDVKFVTGKLIGGKFFSIKFIFR